MNENLPAVQDQHQVPAFQRPAAFGLSNVNAGSVAIESERAIAEAQGKLILAKRFPRSMAACMSEFMDACANSDFAATAFYSVPNRGSGPSIRFMEEAARCYGNFEFGHRELGRSEGKSEIEVVAWDIERNNFSRRQITVMHILDTKNGPKKLVDQADIDNKIAQVASKQMRGRIAALMPKAMVAAGMARCKLTLAGGGDKPISERIMAMTQAFGKFGVTTSHLTAHLGHSIDDTTIDELADLMGIYNAIKEGAKASEFFKLNAEGDDASASTAAAIANRGKAGAAAAKPATAAPKDPVAAPQQKSKPAEAERKSAKADTDESAEKQAPAAVSPDAPATKAQADDDDVF